MNLFFMASTLSLFTFVSEGAELSFSQYDTPVSNNASKRNTHISTHITSIQDLSFLLSKAFPGSYIDGMYG
ncbi:hypothetical protein [Peribacillus sp. SCS-155]|uniref:hypothetical protein n=1 Tax=Peribacillus sedimenti TaxID=3115297 RepID=UPI00390627F0